MCVVLVGAGAGLHDAVCAGGLLAVLVSRATAVRPPAMKHQEEEEEEVVEEEEEER